MNRSHMTAGRGWAIGISYVVMWECLCDEYHLLSRGMDRLRAKHPLLRLLIDAGLIATLLHLTRATPSRYDIYNYIPRSRTEK